MKIFLFTCIFCTLLFGCKKSNQEDFAVLQNANLNHGNYRNSIINPYDSIGIIHNQVLIAVGLMQDFPFTSQEDMGNYILTYMDSLGIDDPEHDLSYYNSIYDDIDKYKNLSELSNQLLDESKINESQLFYLEELNTIIISNIDDNELLNSNINDLETNLLENSNMTDDDKLVIWGALSTARYSANFWYDALTNRENPWHVTYPNSNKFFVIINYTGTAFGRVMADVEGWVSGFCGICEGTHFHCAHRSSVNASRTYVYNHLDIIWFE